MIYKICPLQDPRWTGLVTRHPLSSIFHTREWLTALQQTYGFEPIAYTTSAPGTPLEDAMVLCLVRSSITGDRLVSLPFSDHCAPLLRDATEGRAFLASLDQELRRDNLHYVEIRAERPLDATLDLNVSTQQYCFHRLDLRPDVATLLRNCHKDCTQRKIRRAEREGIVCKAGRSRDLLDAFWNLVVMTRRRHQLPPQPRSWFRNLINCLADALEIRVALRDQQPLAAILTLRHKDTLVYKYGCSDARYSNLGGTQLLFWTAIQDARRDGLSEFDLGRSDCDNAGLITFKDRWGAARSSLTYTRFARQNKHAFNALHMGWLPRAAGSVVACLPDPVFSAVGSIFYRHFA